jgi:hypothetical protein
MKNLDQLDATPVDDQGDGTAGTSGAAALNLSPLRTEIAVIYDVAATSDDIKIEVSTNGSTWREHPETVASGSVVTGGDIVQLSTSSQHVRSYAGAVFADADVNTIETVSKGL